MAPRLQTGTALNRSQLPPDVLRRALSNDLWFETPKREGKGGKKWKKGKKGKKRKDESPVPKGRQPNPTLMSGEGIEPYEIYSDVMEALYENHRSNPAHGT